MKKELVTCIRMYGVWFEDYYQTWTKRFYFYSPEERSKYFPKKYYWDFTVLEPKLFPIEEAEKEYTSSMAFVNSDEEYKEWLTENS